MGDVASGARVGAHDAVRHDAVEEGGLLCQTARVSGYRGRFAPSPTGRAHLGTARTALAAWLRARAEGGVLVMRMEDLDGPRVVPGMADAMLEDLHWLALSWEEGPDIGGPHAPYVQSQRLDRYGGALETLKAKGLAYPCTCSRKEIASIASAPHGEEAVYPGTCRQGPTHPERAPAWRFRLDALPSFEDGVFGVVEDGARGDFVLARADGVFSYQLAVVVDDAEMEITEVVRGQDLLGSTPRQLALFSALSFPAPRYLHVPLVVDANGERLGKRHDSLAIAHLRKAGWQPKRVVALLGRSLGLPVPEDQIDASTLVSRFEVRAIAREPSRIALER